MDIRILHLIEGAQQARGLTIIIDVFRAFSTACYVFGNGAAQILPVGDLEIAYSLKQQNPTWILMGERKGERPPGFDYGNSPTEVEHVDFTGRVVVHTTSAGTQGIVNARQADEILTGSFCNAGAIIAYIRSKRPEQVSLVCMGQDALEPADEDTLCAEFIKASLDGSIPDFNAMRTYLKTYRTARKFFDPTITWAPERDFELCLMLNRFDFVLHAQCDEDGRCLLQKIEVGGIL